jgi:hypothetical protein
MQCLWSSTCTAGSAYYSGKELTVLERGIAINRDAIYNIKQEIALNYIEINWQAILNLLGKSEKSLHSEG